MQLNMQTPRAELHPIIAAGVAKPAATVPAATPAAAQQATHKELQPA